jgi:capsular polysaccharide biosynthesis protein
MNAIPIFKDYSLPESYSLMRLLFQPYIAPTMIKGRKIYIQRKNIETRTFINESEVQFQLEKLGYETILLETHDIKTQIRIVSEAEFIVGAHGAGLAFTVFCNSKAKVLEIYQGLNSEKRHYYHIAHILKHSFMRFQDGIECDKNTETMFVNTSKLVGFLNEWHHDRLF